MSEIKKLIIEIFFILIFMTFIFTIWCFNQDDHKVELRTIEKQIIVEKPIADLNACLEFINKSDEFKKTLWGLK